MCGVFGVVGSIDRELSERCLARLAHRGPDGSGLWMAEGVTLGHRRLSILDLSANGSQPMSYQNGRFQITFNGEIYNFVEIRRELAAKGYSFQSESDTEVILAAFAEWGEECLLRFNGMWAFAIWDSRDQSLFLSRDRFGKKPLFYIETTERFAFASEMKALFPLLPSVEPNSDLVRDAASLFRYEATSECVVLGISRFPAGHCGWVRNGRLSIRRWWCTLDHLPEISNRYEEQVEQLRELFIDACRLRMRSDVPLGTALSGGLDSSATISTMAHIARSGAIERQGEDWQHAFVATFPGTPLDESVYARKVTDYLGINATFIDIDPIKALQNLDRYFWLFEDLYITSPIPFMLTYAAVKSEGISVTLDGHAADELFGGYSFDYLYALDDAGVNIRKGLQVVQTLRDAWPVGSSQFSAIPGPLAFWFKWKLKETAKRFLKRRIKANTHDSKHPQWRRLDNLGRRLYASTHETVLPTLLRNYDRYSMANGVEIRMPFLDHRIACFAFALPWTSKIRNGYSKAVVRDAVSPYMPGEVAYRKTKLGFNSPIVDWIKGPLREFLLDTISRRDFRESTLIDSETVSGAIRQVMDSPDAQFIDGERAWTLLTPYLWERAVIKGEGAPSE